MKKILVIALLLASSLYCATLEKNLKDLKANLENLLNQLKVMPEVAPPPLDRPVTLVEGGSLIIDKNALPEDVKYDARTILQSFVRTHKDFLIEDPRTFENFDSLNDLFKKLEPRLKQTNPHDVIEVFAKLLEVLGRDLERAPNYLELARKYLHLLYLKGRTDKDKFDLDKLSNIERVDWDKLWELVNINPGPYEGWLYEATTGTPQLPPLPPREGVKVPKEGETFLDIIRKHMEKQRRPGIEGKEEEEEDDDDESGDNDEWKEESPHLDPEEHYGSGE